MSDSQALTIEALLTRASSRPLAHAELRVERLLIPTYGVGEPEKNPVFLEKRVYQGSSGVVYPYPVIEKIKDEKVDREWIGLVLENPYLVIVILPELGGRVQVAWDKIGQRHFVYYNQVIKPALVGLTGPWISGGIEFNWPQHHRPSTFEPLDYQLETNPDGSVTAWCSELERMFRTRGMMGFTLYPDKAYLEIKVRLHNRTDFPQTFLWWANPAVKVNDHYQSVFPPDVHAVYDHGRRDVSEFPIAKGVYYKVDYAPGTDISWYKNIPVPTSYMAVNSSYDFLGGYEHDTRAGMLHVANHHVAPGKKQWTWGHSDFGQAWDRNLTDEDGPYIELMCGVFTDNQPDFSWIMPGEEKTFSQYFMPYRELGLVKQATHHAMLNIEVQPSQLAFKVFVTASYPKATIRLGGSDRTFFETVVDLSPHAVYKHQLELPEVDPSTLRFELFSANGDTLLLWKPEPADQKALPQPAHEALLPEQIASNEQLFLTGHHLEQYRHATYAPMDYYREALRRDPGDVRCNNAMGLLHLRKGDFIAAEPYFRAAIATLTERNGNPYDTEPFYHWGVNLRFLQREEQAYEAFYRSAWTAAWVDSAYFQLARIAATAQRYHEALHLVDQSLERNQRHHKARHLKIYLLRKLGRTNEALTQASEHLHMDPLHLGTRFEQVQLHPEHTEGEPFDRHVHPHLHTYLEYALDYYWCGGYEAAEHLLQRYLQRTQTHQSQPSPTGFESSRSQALPIAADPSLPQTRLALYYLAWFQDLQGHHEQASQTLSVAATTASHYAFPHRPEDVLLLEWVMGRQPNDAQAAYLLGNHRYHHRLYEEATRCWEQSARLKPNFPTVHRNLALAYFNKTREPQRACQELETAFRLNPQDARVLMELDQLYKRLNRPLHERLAFLETHHEVVEQRDDLMVELITLLNLSGAPEKAFMLLQSRIFHPWEGGEGKVTSQYVGALTALARMDLQQGQPERAMEHLTRARQYPPHLGEGKLYGALENALDYWSGVVCEQLGQHDQARAFWTEATKGLTEPYVALYYNDQQPDTIFYQGLAYRRLGNEAAATERFQTLLDFGLQHENDSVLMDYFAVSLPDLQIWEDDLNLRNRILCRYLMGLGYAGLKDPEMAKRYLLQVLADDTSHPGAVWHAVRFPVF